MTQKSHPHLENLMKLTKLTIAGATCLSLLFGFSNSLEADPRKIAEIKKSYLTELAATGAALPAGSAERTLAGQFYLAIRDGKFPDSLKNAVIPPTQSGEHVAVTGDLAGLLDGKAENVSDDWKISGDQLTVNGNKIRLTDSRWAAREQIGDSVNFSFFILVSKESSLTELPKSVMELNRKTVQQIQEITGEKYGSHPTFTLCRFFIPHKAKKVSDEKYRGCSVIIATFEEWAVMHTVTQTKDALIFGERGNIGSELFAKWKINEDGTMILFGEDGIVYPVITMGNDSFITCSKDGKILRGARLIDPVKFLGLDKAR